ncbi:MAG: hypothetical protein ACNA7J_13315 [Wenzhouxiangella sp.]
MHETRLDPTGPRGLDQLLHGGGVEIALHRKSLAPIETVERASGCYKCRPGRTREAERKPGRTQPDTNPGIGLVVPASDRRAHVEHDAQRNRLAPKIELPAVAAKELEMRRNIDLKALWKHARRDKPG